MSHAAHHMARGPSGKVVIEVDPSLKDALHARLAAEKTTVKEWFVKHVEEYLRGQQTLPIPLYPVPEPPSLVAADSIQTASYKAGRST